MPADDKDREPPSDDNTNNEGGAATNQASGIAGGPQDTSSFDFILDNPVQTDTFAELFDNIMGRVYALIIPLAVIVIVYSGILMMSSSYSRTPENYNKAKQYLQYTVVALVIIFIGRGFITLLYSIIELRNRV